MTEKAKAARNAYAREYYRKNKDRIKAYNNARWEKKADEMAARGELDAHLKDADAVVGGYLA